MLRKIAPLKMNDIILEGYVKEEDLIRWLIVPEEELQIRKQKKETRAEEEGQGIPSRHSRKCSVCGWTPVLGFPHSPSCTEEAFSRLKMGQGQQCDSLRRLPPADSHDTRERVLELN